MYNSYYVGGYVRDHIIGRSCKDIDIAVEAPNYNSLKEYILNMGYEIFLESPQYYTIRAKNNNKKVIDFVLCRKDSEKYTDGRHPDYVEIGNIFDDLSRRDFKMNACSINVKTGEMYDPFNGQEDIKNKIISCVGNPKDRFMEDSLRILRAIRFCITLGFNIDKEIWNTLKEDSFIYIEMLKNLSIERIYNELDKAFKYDTYSTLVILNTLHEINNKYLTTIFRNNLHLIPSLEHVRKV
jgi:tRNA nucleotidyltransferase/poly(A) polymerase